LYEFTTTAGVPVRLHDMSFLGFTYTPRPPTPVIRFLYDSSARHLRGPIAARHR
jgi:hypothetical protein